MPAGAKVVGKVAIRAIPDTSKFRSELKNKLRTIEKSLSLSVKVDRIRLNKTALRASLQEQLSSMKNLAVQVQAKIDTAQINITEITGKIQAEADKNPIEMEMAPLDKAWAAATRKRLREAIGELDIPIGLEGERVRAAVDGLAASVEQRIKKIRFDMLPLEKRAELRHEIDSIIDRIENANPSLDLHVNPVTAWASARLAWLSRSRVAQIVPQVSKVAAAKVATQLAALSGVRVAGDWTKNIYEMLEGLDRAMPRIALLSTGITSLAAALVATVGGLFSVGAGLASIVPAALVLPGMLMGAAWAVTTLVVALKDLPNQLSPLADDMHELADIIRVAFWDNARQPIIDLVKGLMPQLRASLKSASAALGRFTASLANSFAKATEGGKLESLFAGLAESMDVLAKGTDGFAGMLVSLGQVGAKYAPRLAGWFVDITNTFDAFLKRAADDGSMDKWIGRAIRGMKDLGRATGASARILDGIWKSVRAGGGGGLGGFADDLERIADVVNGPKFQATFESIFRGAGSAMSGFADGLRPLGRLLYDFRYDLEFAFSVFGDTFGHLIGDIADALNTPEMHDALGEFVVGIRSGIKAFSEYLPSIGDGVATLLGFIGTFADSLGTVLGPAVDTLVTALQPIVDAVEKNLPGLAEDVSQAFTDLKPSLERLGDALGPIVDKLFAMASDVLPAVVDLIDTAAVGLAALAEGAANKTNADRTPDSEQKWWEVILEGLGELLDFLSTSQLGNQLQSVLDVFNGELSPTGFMAKMSNGDFGAMWADVPGIITSVVTWFQQLPYAASNAVSQVVMWFQQLPYQIGAAFAQFATDFGQSWSNFWAGNGWVTDAEMQKTEGAVRRGMGGGMSAMQGFQSQGQPMWTGFMSSLSSVAGSAWSQIVSSAAAGVNGAMSWIASLPGRALGALGNLGSFLYSSGRSLLQGFVDGITSMVERVRSAVSTAVDAAKRFFPNSPAKEGPFSGKGWTMFSGQAVMNDWAAGIESRESAPTDALQSAMRAAAALVRPTQITASLDTGGGGSTPAFAPQSSTTLIVNNPLVKDLVDSIREAGQLVNVEGGLV